MKSKKLENDIFKVCRRYTDIHQSKIVAKLITRAEKNGINTHGLHYFLHGVLPLIKEGRVQKPKIKVRKNFVYSENKNSIGIVNAYECIKKASKIAKSKGISLVIIKNPEKVGALRIYCPELLRDGQLVIILKNTASTAGVKAIGEPFIGTNPICIGLPETKFIYDATTATVSTNKMRVYKKKGKKFENKVGINKDGDLSDCPKEILSDGYLLPFSFGNFWYKSFFLGVAIELMSALAGGKTGKRAGKHRGRRLYSKEGMLILIIDSKVFPEYKNYLKEKEYVLSELQKLNMSIPGSKDNDMIDVFKRDLKELQEELIH